MRDDNYLPGSMFLYEEELLIVEVPVQFPGIVHSSFLRSVFFRSSKFFILLFQVAPHIFLYAAGFSVCGERQEKYSSPVTDGSSSFTNTWLLINS